MSEKSEGPEAEPHVSVEQLQAQNDELQAWLREAQLEKQQALQHAELLEKRLANAQENIRLLKRDLHAAEMRCAHLRGYIDRCLEDDHINEGQVEEPAQPSRPYLRQGPRDSLYAQKSGQMSGDRVRFWWDL